MVPSALRPRKCDGFWNDWFVLDDVGRCDLRLPTKTTPARQRIAPRNIPGKKPATTAPAGKGLQWATAGSFESIPETPGLLVLDVVVAVGLVVVELSANELVASSIWQTSFAQVYPKGQHDELPQVGSGKPTSFVVMMGASGYAVTFCSFTSQLIGSMLVQLDPFGQQSAED